MLTNSVTSRYLQQFDRPISPLPESDIEKMMYNGLYLSRPMFLEASALECLERDLMSVHSALNTLPDRAFNGNIHAFYRATGMTDEQIEFILQGSDPSTSSLTMMGRADLYREKSGFRLLELNLGSPIGGTECVDMCRAILGIPDVAEFLAREGLTFAETFEATLDTLRTETGFPPGTSPVMALVETPVGYHDEEVLMRSRAARWTNCGLPTVVGHLGELSRSRGRLLLRTEPVDIVYRMFTLKDVLTQDINGLLEPLLTAVKCGEVAMFTPLESEIYGSKGALALLSEPSGHIGLTAAERDACARLLPWTRIVQPGSTVLEDGSTVDLISYVLENQHDLVLKPSISYGGDGVILGSGSGVTTEMWRQHVIKAAEGRSSVVQRLIHPVPELFPSRVHRGLDAWTVAWGVFTTRHGYAGTFTRGLPVDANIQVVNRSSGASFGCAFHEPRRRQAV